MAENIITLYTPDTKVNMCECGSEITKRASKCIKCHFMKLRIVVRPSIEELRIDIGELGYCGTGKKYAVSDNAIRKWVKTYESEMKINKK